MRKAFRKLNFFQQAAWAVSEPPEPFTPEALLHAIEKVSIKGQVREKLNIDIPSLYNTERGPGKRVNCRSP